MKSHTAWLCKYALINLISRLPGHERLHLIGQKILGKHRLDAPEMLRRALEPYRLARYAGATIEDRVILEIGTGWFPFVPLLGHLLNARAIITVDIHPWLTAKHLRQTIIALRDLSDTIATTLQIPATHVQQCCDQLLTRAPHTRTPAELLLHANIRYLPKTDLLTADLPPAGVDLVLSSNVLEHLPPPILQAIHARTAALTRPGGLAVHRFNPDDHFKTLSGSTITFLKYSDSAWRFLGGRGLSYHNRLRTAEHADLLKPTPWGLLLWADAVDTNALDQIKTGALTPAPRFAAMPPEILCACYAWFIMKKDAPTTAATPRTVRWIDDILTEAAPTS